MEHTGDTDQSHTTVDLDSLKRQCGVVLAVQSAEQTLQGTTDSTVEQEFVDDTHVKQMMASSIAMLVRKETVNVVSVITILAACETASCFSH